MHPRAPDASAGSARPGSRRHGPSDGRGFPTAELGPESIELRLPSVELGRPSSRPGCPAVERRLSRIELGRPRAELRLPNIELGLPSVELCRPGSGPDFPSAERHRPSSAPGLRTMADRTRRRTGPACPSDAAQGCRFRRDQALWRARRSLHRCPVTAPQLFWAAPAGPARGCPAMRPVPKPRTRTHSRRGFRNPQAGPSRPAPQA